MLGQVKKSLFTEETGRQQEKDRGKEDDDGQGGDENEESRRDAPRRRHPSPQCNMVRLLRLSAPSFVFFALTFHRISAAGRDSRSASR